MFATAIHFQNLSWSDNKASVIAFSLSLSLSVFLFCQTWYYPAWAHISLDLTFSDFWPLKNQIYFAAAENICVPAIKAEL